MLPDAVLFQNAFKAYKARDYAAAKPLFREVVQAGRPQWAELSWRFLGDIESDEENNDAALIAYQRAYELNPTSQGNIAPFACALHDADRTEEAAHLIERIPASERRPWTWTFLGTMCRDLGHLSKSKACFDRAMEPDGARIDEPLLNCAMLALVDDPESARGLLRRALEIDPRYDAAFQCTVMAYCFERQFEEAEKLATEWLECGESPALQQMCGFLADVRHQHERAEEHLRRAIKLKGGIWSFVLLAEVLDSLGWDKRAEEMRERTLRGPLRRAFDQYLVANLLMVRGSPAAARRWFEKIASHLPGTELAQKADLRIAEIDSRA